MGKYSGLPMMSTWTIKSITWLKSHVASGVVSVTTWSSELADKAKFWTKYRLIKKLR